VIFVTIGSMFPFDRLIRAMDAWAEANPCEMLAQIGDGGFEPAHMPWVRKLDRAEYVRTVERAALIVAHAGMGTVITAAEYAKPVVLLPRRGPLGEHNNDHQADTAVWLRTRPGIHVAADEAALPACIAAVLQHPATGAADSIGASAPAAFLARIRAFVQAEGRAGTRGIRSVV
jgi:UDP-N-acetylglucosamine transferase subunit ALG13